jgi:hypothetical protein
MADLFSLAAAEEAQGRRRQLLPTAFGPSVAAALADPAPSSKAWSIPMANYGLNGPPSVARTRASTSPAGGRAHYSTGGCTSFAGKYTTRLPSCPSSCPRRSHHRPVAAIAQKRTGRQWGGHSRLTLLTSLTRAISQPAITVHLLEEHVSDAAASPMPLFEIGQPIGRSEYGKGQRPQDRVRAPQLRQ